MARFIVETAKAEQGPDSEQQSNNDDDRIGLRRTLAATTGSRVNLPLSCSCYYRSEHVEK